MFHQTFQNIQPAGPAYIRDQLKRIWLHWNLAPLGKVLSRLMLWALWANLAPFKPSKVHIQGQRSECCFWDLYGILDFYSPVSPAASQISFLCNMIPRFISPLSISILRHLKFEPARTHLYISQISFLEHTESVVGFTWGSGNLTRTHLTRSSPH